MISSDDLNALDEFQNLLQELVEADERRGKRTETFPLKHKDADVAAGMLKAMMDGGANVSSSFPACRSAAEASAAWRVCCSAAEAAAHPAPAGPSAARRRERPRTITPDVSLNVLYITAVPRDLDNIEQLLELIDREASPDPPAAMKRRFIPVVHGKAADVDRHRPRAVRGPDLRRIWQPGVPVAAAAIRRRRS